MKKAIAGIAVALVMLSACGSDSATEETVAEVVAEEAVATEAGDIVAVASATEGFSTLVAALTAGGIHHRKV